MPTPTPPHPNPTRRWILFIVASLALFAFVPLAGAIQRPLREAVGDGTLRVAAMAVVAGVALLGGAWARQRRWLDLRGLCVTLVLGGVLAFVMWRLHAAAEALHVLQYFLVGVLAFRALSPHVEGHGLYLGAFALTALVGVGDEFVQWLTPGRYWDLRDVALNAGSGLAAQAWIAFALRPQRTTERYSALPGEG